VAAAEKALKGVTGIMYLPALLISGITAVLAVTVLITATPVDILALEEAVAACTM
jgi:hypothetical protein